MYKKRYIYDALYGIINLPDYVWETMLCPEVQRLRDVRLCNINSLCLPGGANINRYEHSIGTVHLAVQCLQNWPVDITQTEKKRIVLAALLHDIGSAAFGHSVQYVLDNRGYEHESVYDMVGTEASGNESRYRYQYSRFQSIYFGIPRRLPSILNDVDLRSIADMITGQGTYGPLISGSVDLDNIDNVYRLAYHIGLTKEINVPIKLARSVWLEDGQLIIAQDALSLIENWYEVRKNLYKYLLLNPDEFSAKCMLQEALELAQERSEISFYWHDVDYQLLEKLANSTDEASTIVSRLMMGDLYGCLGIYSTSNIDAYNSLAFPENRRAFESHIESQLRGVQHNMYKKAIIGIHIIKDVNKTERQVELLTSENKKITIGTPSSRLLIGVFFKNIQLSMLKVNEQTIKATEIREIVRIALANLLADAEVKEIEPYDEAG